MMGMTWPAPRRSRASTVNRRDRVVRASATYSASYVFIQPSSSATPHAFAVQSLRAARRHGRCEQPLERDLRQARGDLLPPAHLVQRRRHFGPEERGRDEALVSEQVETVGRETRLDRCAGVEDDHGSAPFARTADSTDDVRHRLTGSSPAPRRGQATLRRRDERQQIRLFDEVLRPGAARPESARSDPTPDGPWVATYTAGGFRDGEHRSSVLQQIGRRTVRAAARTG
jgi:hypothetical protein